MIKKHEHGVIENYGKAFKNTHTINDVYNNINNYKQDRNHMILTLTAIGIFGATLELWGEKAFLSLKPATHLITMKFGTVLCYLKKIKKIYELRDIQLDFSPKISNLYQEMQIQTAF